MPLLANRYSLGERLGGGGMAVVYRAFDERLHREVAVKLLDSSQHRDDALHPRFEIEARAAAAINHPRVVAVYDVGTEGDLRFIVMECLPGPTLADELRRVGPLPHARVTTVLTDVLDGLGAAHTQGVLHRDIKPSNVLIDADGRAKLADFGIAATTGNDLTNTGLVIGTPSYLAPERVAGRRASVQSDLYAVGVVAYEALSGTRPFVGDSALALAHAIHEAHPRPLRELRADVPEGLADLVMRAMAAAPAARPATAEEFARQLADGGASRGSYGAGRVDGNRAVRADRRQRPRCASGTPNRCRSHETGARSVTAACRAGAGRTTRDLVLGVSLWSLTQRDDGTAGPNPSAPTTTPPALPDPLEEPFDRLAEVVQP